MVLDIGSHCRLGFGLYVSLYLRALRRYQFLSLARELLYRLRPSPVSSVARSYLSDLLEHPTMTQTKVNVTLQLRRASNLAVSLSTAHHHDEPTTQQRKDFRNHETSKN
jgi:hypothetical protein